MNNCPKCKASWIGEPIPESARKYYGTHTHFKREIAIEIQGKGDRVDHYLCPDCGHEISREEYNKEPQDDR